MQILRFGAYVKVFCRVELNWVSFSALYHQLMAALPHSTGSPIVKIFCPRQVQYTIRTTLPVPFQGCKTLNSFMALILSYEPKCDFYCKNMAKMQSRDGISSVSRLNPKYQFGLVCQDLASHRE